MPAEGDGSLAMVAIRQNMHYVGLTFTEHHVPWLQLLFISRYLTSPLESCLQWLCYSRKVWQLSRRNSSNNWIHAESERSPLLEWAGQTNQRIQESWKQVSPLVEDIT